MKARRGRTCHLTRDVVFCMSDEMIRKCTFFMFDIVPRSGTDLYILIHLLLIYLLKISQLILTLKQQLSSDFFANSRYILLTRALSYLITRIRKTFLDDMPQYTRGKIHRMSGKKKEFQLLERREIRKKQMKQDPTGDEKRLEKAFLVSSR